MVLGWFGFSILWLLPLLWRLGARALARERVFGPGSLRVAVGTSIVLCASASLEALTAAQGSETGGGAAGHALAGLASHAVGWTGALLLMLGVLALAAPMVFGESWRSLFLRQPRPARAEPDERPGPAPREPDYRESGNAGGYVPSAADRAPGWNEPTQRHKSFEAVSARRQPVWQPPPRTRESPPQPGEIWLQQAPSPGAPGTGERAAAGGVAPGVRAPTRLKPAAPPTSQAAAPAAIGAATARAALAPRNAAAAQVQGQARKPAQTAQPARASQAPAAGQAAKAPITRPAPTTAQPATRGTVVSSPFHQPQLGLQGRATTLPGAQAASAASTASGAAASAAVAAAATVATAEAPAADRMAENQVPAAAATITTAATTAATKSASDASDGAAAPESPAGQGEPVGQDTSPATGAAGTGSAGQAAAVPAAPDEGAAATDDGPALPDPAALAAIRQEAETLLAELRALAAGSGQPHPVTAQPLPHADSMVSAPVPAEATAAEPAVTPEAAAVTPGPAEAPVVIEPILPDGMAASVEAPPATTADAVASAAPGGVGEADKAGVVSPPAPEPEPAPEPVAVDSTTALAVVSASTEPVSAEVHPDAQTAPAAADESPADPHEAAQMPAVIDAAAQAPDPDDAVTVLDLLPTMAAENATTAGVAMADQMLAAEAEVALEAEAAEQALEAPGATAEPVTEPAAQQAAEQAAEQAVEQAAGAHAAEQAAQAPAPADPAEAPEAAEAAEPLAPVDAADPMAQATGDEAADVAATEDEAEDTAEDTAEDSTADAAGNEEAEPFDANALLSQASAPAGKPRIVLPAVVGRVVSLQPPAPPVPPPPPAPPRVVDYRLPPAELLEAAGDDIEHVPQARLDETRGLIEQRLAEFKVPVAVVGASAGPVITRFEVEPAMGVRGAQVVGLMKDLARALGVTSIRVVETIPGKTCMGLELPNAKRQMIRLSEVVRAASFQSHASRLVLAMGKDITGNPVVTDLARAPHLLVAGTTGSGKSVAVNAMILSMLYKATPEDVRLIMIDPKMLELSVYEGIPHLLAPVVTDMKQAAHALNWCVGEMEKRYRLMSALGVRNLAGYNQKIRAAAAAGEKVPNPFSLTPDAPEPLNPLPLIVVVIDELADLMMVAGKKIEELIARLAQKARAAGIHLILATQRPSVDVITGLIKANIPTRVAFQVSSKIDSRTILDQMGAETLLGQGDMLFLPPGTGYPQRVHGAFVADDEVHRVVEHWKQFGEPDYDETILAGDAPEGAADLFGEGGQGGDGESDPLYDEAAAFVLTSRRASISAVQRQLRIGYNRAARLIEQMEVAGLVSPMGRNGARDVIAPGGGD